MSEHIKTGNEIYLGICGICCDVDNIRSDKWVSLSWLKKQINTKFRKSLPDFWSDDDKQRTIDDILNLFMKEH